MDREKVIKDLEECLSASCRGYRPRLSCPYNDEEWDIMRDALALLKEDCHNCKLECLLQKYDQLKEKYDKLLKEQEAVEPINAFKRVNGTTAYSCPRCAALIVDGSYCKHCGQAVKWE